MLIYLAETSTKCSLFLGVEESDKISTLINYQKNSNNNSKNL